ncbi:hypothetical protein GOP47_0025972 [Adiantum capillus-veneris]|uniref:BHLH domain-containing protein n=1 Tax=Adiantum capillus-veneris TaxID=13818 RepID=A0A9D4U0R6_ADICA|nr:hypothetical protein GOP47_0025281 [Adiantum capillus-veneris]KAI5059653.1 hypothetical protein GOP47_0025972 [Adiantum capillus-veneris]
MSLQKTLKNLCSKSGWCYAVFWKLKRRSRMVLTWEDGYYEFQSAAIGGNLSCLESGGNLLAQGGALHDTSYGQIGLAVAKMSYCVYFMGEGIIGHVAFTGKHQWVFSGGDTSSLGTTHRNAIPNQCMLEKYPSSWEVQFAAGIKTIAIIAVPQGVVQLGSTQAIMESTEWVDHVKSTFGALQSSQAGLVQLEGQGGNLTRSPLETTSGYLPTRLCKADISQPSTQGTVDIPNVGLQSLVYGLNGRFCASAQSNSQRPLAWIESPESLQGLPPKSEILHGFDIEMGSKDLRPSEFDSSVQKSETLPAASGLVSSSNQQGFLPFEGVRQGFLHGDIKSIGSRNGLEEFPSLDAFGRVSGPCADTDVLTSFHQQSNKNGILAHGSILDSGNLIPLIPMSDNSMQQVKGTGSFGVYPSADLMITSDSSGLLSNMGNVAACSQSSLGGKSCGNQEVLIDSVAGGMSHKTFPDEVSSKPCSAGPVSLPEGTGDKSLLPGGWDSFETYLASVAQGQSSNWDCSLGIGDELSQALGPCFHQNRSKREKPSVIDQDIVAANQHTSGRTCTLPQRSAGEVMPLWGSNFVKSEPLFSESKSESLLDAVVASASSSHLSISTAADDSFSCRTFSRSDAEFSASTILKTTPIKHAGSLPSQDCMSQSIVHAGPVGCEAAASSQALNKVLCDPLGFNMSTTCPPLKTILSSWTEDMQSMRSESTQASQLKKPDDPAKATRKRARPGESTRPRPKDRQQIQDRVRELREIVPNGSKCSIDALLEKTIKHMLFLQNVTLHADNLKKNGELKDDVESGASWALELGGEETGHPPILVKNLNQPRQLLVVMFCEEKGHFLEIADVIRSLGLTILKGVMETRADKIWARFVVEANRDVRRLDIMMSLTRLLHVNNNSTSSMTIGSQTAPLRSQPVLDCSSSSQTQTQTFSTFLHPSPLHA